MANACIKSDQCPRLKDISLVFILTLVSATFIARSTNVPVSSDINVLLFDTVFIAIATFFAFKVTHTGTGWFGLNWETFSSSTAIKCILYGSWLFLLLVVPFNFKKFFRNPFVFHDKVIILTSMQYLQRMILAVVAAPLAEEILFRGMILRTLLSRVKYGYAAFISTVLFALVHPGPAGLVMFGFIHAFVFGIVCCNVYKSESNILASYIVHSSYNCWVEIMYLLIGFPPTT